MDSWIVASSPHLKKISISFLIYYIIYYINIYIYILLIHLFATLGGTLQVAMIVGVTPKAQFVWSHVASFNSKLRRCVL